MSVPRGRLRLATLAALLGAAPVLAQSADLFVSKTAPASANVGDNVTYTITIGNNGPDGASNATVTDTLPPGATFVSETQTNGPVFSCSTPALGGSGGSVVCTIATFASGASATFQIVQNVPAGAAGTTLINNAGISSDTPDPNPENDASVSGTSIPGGNLADVGVTKTAPAGVAPGANVTFTITVSNFGPNDASSVTLADTLGAGLTFVSLAQTSGPAFTCPGGTTPCTIATLPNGSAASFQLVATASSTPGTYTNTASVTSANDPNPDNDSASASVFVSSADVGITKSAPATAVAGGTVTYTLALSNAGPGEAAGVQATDALPAGTTYVSLTQTTGPTLSCTTPAPGAGGTIRCGLGSLLNGQSATFNVVVALASSVPAGAIVSNTATVASAISTDPNPANNSSTASTTATASADVSVTKTGPASVLAGTNVAYNVTVTNAGPSDATTVSLTDVLPSGTTFVSLSQTSGPAFACTGGAAVTCTIASLPASAAASFTLTAATSPGATGTVSNTASVSSTTPDTNPGNNSSTSTAALSTSADVSIGKTAASAAVPGSNVAYTITVANAGPSDASTVTFSDTLPAPLTFVSITQTSGPAFACSGAATVSCSIASLASGATAVFTLTAAIPAGFTGTVSNTATVTSATSDPNPANDTSTAAISASSAAIPTLPPGMMLALALALGAAGWWTIRKAL